MNKDNIFIAAIGASAGGLRAIEDLIESLEPNDHMAYVIIQHLSPDHQSYMDEILRRKTDLDILYAKNGLTIEANKIYLIPPNKLLKIYEDKFFLDDLKYHDTNNLPINTFFKFLAYSKYSRSIGIVLSGTGSDGTNGIGLIKNYGGITFAQTPESSEFDSMPKNSINSGYIDYILSPSDIAFKLNEIANNIIYSNGSSDENKKESFYKIMDILKIIKNIDFRSYKLETISRRIDKRIKSNNLNDINEYHSLIKNNENEVDILYKELLIGVTEFFRNEDHFNILYEKAILQLVNNASEGQVLRIWDVGCSTGEEAYSIAFLFEEAIKKFNKNIDYKIFATDINSDSLNKGAQGVYSNSIISEIPKEFLDKYFIQKSNKFIVKNDIKKNVIFSKHNILNDPPFSKIDLISCRNLLIYLKSEEQEKILSMFHFSLNFNSFLFLGPSESIGSLIDMFKVIDSKAKLFNYLSGHSKKLSDSYKNYSKIISRNEEKIHNDINFLSNNNFDKSLNIFQNLLDEILPPAILIDSNYNLIHIFNGAGKYMEFSDGKISLNVLKMFSKEIRIIIESSILKFKNDNDESIKKYLSDNNIEISIKSIQKNNYFLITFEENKDEKQKYKVIDINENMKERINNLENELIKKEDDLQDTIQQLETSNEELQSANEQLISSNEELQSTNEELQSVNEELYTVNSEYQGKIEELTDLNNDLNNYLNANNIGTIFLDKKLNIRKFTPSATSEFSLIKVDLGRPIYHITHNFDYENLYNDCLEVLENMKPKEKYLTSKKNKEKIYLLRILPYLTDDNFMKGIIITFLDITEIKKHNNISITNLSNDFFCVLGFDGYLIDANKSLINYIENFKDKNNNSFFYFVDDEFRNNVISSFEETIKSQEVITTKIKFKNKNDVFKIKFKLNNDNINCFIVTK